ncbi:MAG: NfeD family protein [Oscillospiraceae bacterium]|nr:NfeD family protein [Oscillospiraceae bacterium]
MWFIAMVAMLGVELATVSLTSIWFALGALAALIAALCGAPIWLQVVWFLVVSVLALIATRPLVKKYINGKTTPTNADMLMGQTCVVTEPISNLSETGAVKIGGKVWTARSEDGTVFAPGEKVIAVRIEGVKLIVTSPNNITQEV